MTRIARFLVRLMLRMMPPAVVVELPEDRTQAAIDRGRRAQSLINDPALDEAFGAIEQRLADEWRNSASASRDKREVLFHQVAALQSVRDQLKRWSEDAVFLAAKLEKQRS